MLCIGGGELRPLMDKCKVRSAMTRASLTTGGIHKTVLASADAKCGPSMPGII